MELLANVGYNFSQRSRRLQLTTLNTSPFLSSAVALNRGGNNVVVRALQKKDGLSLAVNVSAHRSQLPLLSLCRPRCTLVVVPALPRVIVMSCQPYHMSSRVVVVLALLCVLVLVLVVPASLHVVVIVLALLRVVVVMPSLLRVFIVVVPSSPRVRGRRLACCLYLDRWVPAEIVA